MSRSFKKSYKFAFKSAVLISIVITLILSVFLFIFFQLQAAPLLLFMLSCFVLSFLIIQFRVEQFIYKRVKRIYDDLTLLESSSFRREQITTDMATLTEEIDRYAQKKASIKLHR